MGSKVLSTGSLDLSRLNWDNGTIGVANESRVSSGVCVGSNGKTSSGQVLSTGLLDSWLINGDNGSIGVGNKARVSQWVVDVIVCLGVSIGSIVNVGITVVSIGISVEGKSIVKTIVAIVLVTVGSKVGSLSSLDLKGLGWSNSSIGVGNKLSAGSSYACEENL